MLSSARPAVNGYPAGSARSGEGIVGDQHLVIPAQRFAAMVADPVDTVLPVFDVALGAFPGHNRLPACLSPGHLPQNPDAAMSPA